METDVVSRVTRLVADALGVEPDRVSEEAAMGTMAEWDSMGHLNILTALEQSFGNQVAKIPGLAKATSVKALLTALQTHGVITS